MIRFTSFVGVLLICCASLQAQISVNADFTFEPTANNSEKILFYNATTVTGTTNGVHTYFFKFLWGTTTGSVSSAYTASNNGSWTSYPRNKDYGNTGSWQVTLEAYVKGSNGQTVASDIVTKTVTISASNQCLADFSYSPATAGSQTINFLNNSTSSLQSPSTTSSYYVWDFKDGNSSSQVNPTHTYANPGHYYPSLSVYHVDNTTSDTLVYDSYSRVVSVAMTDSCHANFNYTVSPANHLQHNFMPNGYSQWAMPGATNSSYSWDFGDGSSSGQTYASHTYASNGTYQVSLIIQNINMADSSQSTICMDTVTKTIVVTQPTFQCNADFSLAQDTTSGPNNGNLLVYNHCTPAQGANYNVSYLWDFGDGDTSHQAYPSHTYAGPGTYLLCVTMWASDMTGYNCTDTYCDTISIDSTGNFHYKQSSGSFTINVVNPATVGVDETPYQDVNIYPNPARAFINVDGLKSESHFTITDVRGVTITEGVVDTDQKQVDLPAVSEGLYLIHLQSGEGQKTFKVWIKK